MERWEEEGSVGWNEMGIEVDWMGEDGGLERPSPVQVVEIGYREPNDNCGIVGGGNGEVVVKEEGCCRCEMASRTPCWKEKNWDCICVWNESMELCKATFWAWSCETDA